MPAATFDTLKFANTLKAAGVPAMQAEAQAVAFAEVIQINLKDLVTKEDLAATSKDLRQEMKDIEQRTNSKIDNSIADVKVQIAQVKGELVLMRWMLGVIVGGIAALLIRLFFFHSPI